MSFFKDDRTSDRLIDVLAALASAIKGMGGAEVTAQRLSDHMAECERRNIASDEKSDKRHAENTTRLDRQDTTLRWVLGGVFSILVSTITLFITMLVEGKHL